MKDYKFRSASSPVFNKRASGIRLWLVLSLILATGAIYGALRFDPDKAANATSAERDTPVELQLALPATDSSTLNTPSATEIRDEKINPIAVDAELTTLTKEILPEKAIEPGRWLEHTIASGDSLSKVFKGFGLSPTLLHQLVNSSKTAKQLARIKPGQILKVHLDDEDRFTELMLVTSRTRTLNIVRDDEGFSADWTERDVELRENQVFGTIESSLFADAQQAGLSDRLIMELAAIFGWDIDFALEIRAGDRFSVVFSERWLDGEKLGDGPILAAEFVNRGNVYRAVRFEDDKGHASYYSPDGKSMRKAFLRAPVDFRRISSKFRKERYHPVLGKKRPHKGVDYAAATGTPVRAAGDGKVIFRGRKGGYGNTVILQHANKYTTLYAHLSRYNKNARRGQRVKQGQTIGYVGQTGLATGPHLHYEFRVSGVHRNPLTVKLPTAAPLAKKYRTAFSKQSRPLLARLDALSETLVANAE